mgnify:CR=1 FL=1
MAYSVELTARAKDDLEAAVRWIARHSADQAALWMFECEQAIEGLAESPYRCRLAPESRADERDVRQLLHDQYRILFEIEDETVTVLHIRHQKRQPFALDEL